VNRRQVEALDFDDLDDLVMGLIELRNIKRGYGELGLDAPDWLQNKLREGEVELNYRLRDAKERKLAKLKLQKERLKTPDQKRSDVDAEIAKLESELK